MKAMGLRCGGWCILWSSCSSWWWVAHLCVCRLSSCRALRGSLQRLQGLISRHLLGSHIGLYKNTLALDGNCADMSCPKSSVAILRLVPCVGIGKGILPPCHQSQPVADRIKERILRRKSRQVYVFGEIVR